LFSILLIGCEPLEISENDWKNLSEESSRSWLEEYFTLLPEMENITGKERDAGLFGWEVILNFDLPENQEPEYWLSDLAIKSSPEGSEDYFVKAGDLHYCHDEFSECDSTGGCFLELKYIIKSKRYEARDYCYD